MSLLLCYGCSVAVLWLSYDCYSSVFRVALCLCYGCVMTVFWLCCESYVCVIAVLFLCSTMHAAWCYGSVMAMLWLSDGCVTGCMQCAGWPCVCVMAVLWLYYRVRAGWPCVCVMAMLWLCYDCYRVHAACGVALWLAVKHFHNSQVSSACVAFVEMLGGDSIVLRTYIHAGETMLAHRVRGLPVAVDRRKELLRTSEQAVGQCFVCVCVCVWGYYFGKWSWGGGVFFNLFAVCHKFPQLLHPDINALVDTNWLSHAAPSERAP